MVRIPANVLTKKIFVAITVLFGVLILIVVWLSTYGINKTIDRTINADVYEDDNWSSIASSIEISGNLKKHYFLQVSLELLQ